MRTFEDNLTAWIDGELSGDDLVAFEKEFGGRANLLSEKSGANSLGELLRAHTIGSTLTNADFFNHQIMERIQVAAPDPVRAPFFSLARLAWAGAFCLLVAALLFHYMIPLGPQRNPSEAEYLAQVLDTHTGDPAISATAFHSTENNVTVLWLDGLDYIPEKEVTK
jgi:hypothetical protein